MQIREFVNKNIYSEIVKELIVLAEMEGAEGTCLNIIENLPPQMQLKLVLNLAKSNNAKLVPFFTLLSQEKSGELQKIAEKTLKKYESLGLYIKPQIDTTELPPKILQAFATPTRLEGNCVLVFVTEGTGDYHVHYFSLAFNHLGIKEYFQYKSRNKNDLLKALKNQELVALSIKEGQKLLLEALNQNKKYSTKHANGYSQYAQFLNLDNQSLGMDYQSLTRKLCKKEITPENIINAYLLGLKNMDAGLIYDLSNVALKKVFGTREEFTENWVNPLEKYNFIKNVFMSKHRKDNYLFYDVVMVASDECDDLKKIDFKFKLTKWENAWEIVEVQIEDFAAIDNVNPLNPLNYRVYTDIFKVGNSKLIQKHLESWQEIHLTGEFDNGLCYKWFKLRNPIKDGIDICQDVYCEFILTNKELIIFSSSVKNIAEISYKLMLETKNINEVSLEMVKRNSCSVREIYQVISSEVALLSDCINNCEIIYIPGEEIKRWYNIFSGHYSEKFILHDSIKVFQIKDQQIDISGIFSGKQLLIINYGCCFEAVIKRFEIEDADFIEIGSHEIKTGDKWNKLKYLYQMKKDPKLGLLSPLVIKQNIAKEMGILL